MLRSTRRLSRLASQLQDLKCLSRTASVTTLGASRNGGRSLQWGVRNGDESYAVNLPLCAFGSQQRGLRTATPLWEDVTITVPSMGDSITEGSIASIEKKEGDSVSDGDVLAQIETDKVTIDVKYTEVEGGVLTKVLIKEEDTVTVGQDCFVIEQGAAGSSPAAEKKESAPVKKPAPAEGKSESKKAQKPSTESSQQKAAPKPASKPPPAPKATQKPSSEEQSTSTTDRSGRPERRVKMTRLRMRVADRLKGAQNTYAMLTTFNEVDMTGLMQLRADYKDAFLEKHGIKLGFMSAFVKASVEALLAIPAVNGVIDGTDIIYKDYCDISIAVATPKGLVVPVLRNAHTLDFAGVERGINALGKKARDGSISIDDMAGGTFTISNGGVYGSMLSTPIINPPQSAVLGMHAITQRATVVGKEILPRPIMNVALTYDHRLIDGREAVTFLKRLKAVIEDPRRLLLNV